MKIEVVYSLWAADGAKQPFQGGVQGPDERSELASPSAKLLRSIAGAEAAGVVRVVEATKDERAKLDRAVQSQKDGERAQAKAMGDPHPDLLDDGRENPLAGVMSGPWQHGNHADFVAQRRALLKAAATPGSDVVLTKAERAAIERDVAEAEQRLSEMKAPS